MAKWVNWIPSSEAMRIQFHKEDPYRKGLIFRAMQKRLQSRFYLLVFALLCTNLPASAQFLIVKDKDGFVNVRKRPIVKSAITDTLSNGCLLYYYEEPAGNWQSVNYTKGGKDKWGFIYNSRTFPVDSFQAIPTVSLNKNIVILLKGDLKIVATQLRFDVRRHKITYDKGSDQFVTKVDGKRFWGTDGGLPRTQYGNVVITIAGKQLKLPAQVFQDLFEPTLSNTKANWDEATKTLYIQSSNSDAAGSYLVIWKIVDGIYKERFVTLGL